MTTLQEFNADNNNAPILKPEPRQRLPVPVLAETDGTAGIGGYLQNGTKAYVSPRVRNTHYFRMHSGYAFSNEIIQYLKRSGIWAVLIQESDTNNVLQYDINDFDSLGIAVEYTEGDPQTCVPEKYACVWENHADKLL